jgi:hypothetical protein
VTRRPTKAPTKKPTLTPTLIPTTLPTNSPTVSPSYVPSPSPSSLPTVACNLNQDTRELLIRIFLNRVSDSETLEALGTPQNSAFNWLLNEDSAYLCPQEPNLVQRYVLAVHYFSTRGNRWFQCSAPANFDDPESVAQANDACTIVAEPGTRVNNSFAWLTGASECQWGGIACDGAGEVIRLDMGKE